MIHQRIVEGSTIWSDTFAPYFTLGDEGYTHSMVNHSVEFVTEDLVHTNRIESLWGQIKRFIKFRKGLTREMLSLHLDEFMFRHIFSNEESMFLSFLDTVRQQYPLP